MNDQFEKPKGVDGNIDGNKKINFDQSSFERRKYRLNLLFENLHLPVRTIGNDNSPAFILDDNLRLSVFVRNFELIFTDVPDQGDHLLKVKLTMKNINDKQLWVQIYQALIVSTHRPVHRIQLDDTHINMFLSGYNFLNKKTSYGRYPVFSQINPKIYFSESSAIEQINSINESDIGYYNLSTYIEPIRIETYFDNFINKIVENSVK